MIRVDLYRPTTLRTLDTNCLTTPGRYAMFQTLRGSAPTLFTSVLFRVDTVGLYTSMSPEARYPNTKRIQGRLPYHVSIKFDSCSSERQSRLLI
jgi:hypothetical protein